MPLVCPNTLKYTAQYCFWDINICYVRAFASEARYFQYKWNICECVMSLNRLKSGFTYKALPIFSCLSTLDARDWFESVVCTIASLVNPMALSNSDIIPCTPSG